MKQNESFAAEMLENIRKVSADGPGVTRPSFGAAEDAAHGILGRYAAEMGLPVRVDDALNTWIELPGLDPELPMIVTGSHLDSVRIGGNFDGAAGVVAGLCALRQLQDGPRLSRTVAVVAFRGEESAWFGTCYVGSRAITGQLSHEMLAARSPESQQSLAEAMRDAGANVTNIMEGKTLLDPQSVHRFLEVHIEQGPNLEASGHAVGVVTGIRGNRRYSNIRWAGESGHSGAVPRALRKDAVLGVAEWLVEVEQEWIREEQDGSDLVVTSGIVSTNPLVHGVTSIPGAVKTTLDIRSVDPATLGRVDQSIQAYAEAVAARRGLRVEFGPMIETAPASISPDMVSLIEDVAAGLGQSTIRLPSGAGHDAAALAAAGIEIGMIFVRNANGSHNPNEKMEVSDLCIASDILAGAIREFDVSGQ